MARLGSFVCAAFLVVAGVGCGGPASEDVEVSTGEAKGCRTVCPKCRPGQPCPATACYLDCHAPTPCGPNKCAAGQVCCNESCGICTEPGGVCTQQICEPAPTTCTTIALCIQGYHWSDVKCACVPDSPAAPGACTTDADCRTFSDYCTGCDCRALGASDPNPVCSGPGVRCFADPCMNQTAVCLNGTCALAASGTI